MGYYVWNNPFMDFSLNPLQLPHSNTAFSFSTSSSGRRWVFRSRRRRHERFGFENEFAILD